MMMHVCLAVYKLETLTFRSLLLFALLAIVRSELGTTRMFATAKRPRATTKFMVNKLLQVQPTDLSSVNHG